MKKPGIFRPGRMDREEIYRRTAWTVATVLFLALWGLIIWGGFLVARWVME